MIDYDKVLTRADEILVELCPEMDEPKIRSRQVRACLQALVETLNDLMKPVTIESGNMKATALDTVKQKLGIKKFSGEF